MDDSLDDLSDLWRECGGGEAEAERHADKCVPDAKAHVADKKRDGCAQDHHEGKCDSQIFASSFSVGGSPRRSAVSSKPRTCSPATRRTARRSRLDVGRSRMLARWSSTWIPAEISVNAATAIAPRSAAVIVISTAPPSRRAGAGAACGAGGEYGIRICGSDVCRVRVALRTRSA